MDDIKRLAAETYNQAYDAVESGQDAAWAVELAATSLNLWRRVGNEQNLSIGCWLYSRALVLAGAHQAAIKAAKASLNHIENIDDPADWLVASGLEGFARALTAAAHADAAEALKAAKHAVERIADAEDRELIAGQLADLL